MPTDRTHYDVIIAGLGTAGAATAMELASRGYRVRGFDADVPPHANGSHHGRTRSVRRAYMEGTAYVPMALRAWDLWQKLGRDSGDDHLVPTGNLTVGPEDSSAIAGVQRSAQAYDMPFEMLTAADIRARWPALDPPDGFAGILEVEAGISFPERAVAAMLSHAHERGAELTTETRVSGWVERGGGVDVTVVHAGSGEGSASSLTYSARALVIAAGARTNQLLGGRIAPPLITPRRVPVCWFEPRSRAPFAYGSYPVNFWQIPDEFLGLTGQAGQAGRSPWEVYSLPVTPGVPGVKVAAHNRLVACDPDSDPPQVREDEIAALRRFADACIPGLRGAPVTAERCFYAMTEDGEFRVGPVPGTQCVFAGAFAGHGFKFAPVLGEILADFATGRSPAFELSLFALDRGDRGDGSTPDR